MVPATEQGEIRERGGAALGPVLDVMPLADPDATARETAAEVSMLERPPYGRRNRAGPCADFRHAPTAVVAHDDASRVAGQALRRSGRNAHTVFDHRLPGLVGFAQDGGAHSDHYLVPFSRRPRDDA